MKKKILRKSGNLSKAVALLAVSAFPQIALAGGGGAAPIQGMVDWLLATLTGPIAITVATIAIVILGYMAFVGRMTWERAISIIVGIVLIFGAAALVQVIQGASGGG